MSQHVGPDGVPLRHDGTPFPPDPSQWTDAEKEYLSTYYFGHRENLHDDTGQAQLVASIPEINPDADGSAIA